MYRKNAGEDRGGHMVSALEAASPVAGILGEINLLVDTVKY